jgi:hypothetical protein
VIATSATSQIWKKEHCDSGPQMQVLSRGLQIWVNNISMTLKTPICALLLLVVTHSFRSVCGIKSGLFRFSSVKSGVVRSGMLQFIGVKTSSGQFFSLANFFAKKGNSKFKSSKMN